VINQVNVFRKHWPSLSADQIASMAEVWVAA